MEENKEEMVTSEEVVENINAVNTVKNSEVVEVSNPKDKEETKTEENKKKSNNNKSSILLIIIIAIVVVASCVGVFCLLNNNNNTKDNKEEKTEENTSILFTEKDLPRIDASLATQPLTDSFIKDFTGKTTKEMKVEYSNTHPGYVKLINNEADLIVVTQPSDEELELAKKNNVELEVTKVVHEAFVFFTNINNKVDSLTLEQIQDIYSGKITNWNQVGGEKAKIIAFQRPVNSGSQTGLLNLVMQGKKVKIPTSTEKIEDMAGIIDYVADYDNGKNAIGYSYYYYAETMYKNDNVKYMGVNGVKPTTETIQNGTYPIRTAYYIVTRKGEKNENVLKLKDAMLSDRGQKVAKEAGYVPVK